LLLFGLFLQLLHLLAAQFLDVFLATTHGSRLCRRVENGYGWGVIRERNERMAPRCERER
jgi:hypothetical protein